jgi:hypothetical protein
MDPTRLLDADEDRFETRLLGAARDDAPPRGALRRAEVALGFGVSAGMVATAAATGTAKAATAHIGAAHTVVAQVGAASVLKWLGIGLVSGAVVTGGLRYAVTVALPAPVARPSATQIEAPLQNRKSARRTAPRRTPAGAPVEDRSAFTELPVPAPMTPEADEPPVEPKIVAPARAPRSSSLGALGAIGVKPDGSARAPSLSAELSILERARHALLEQRPGAVLRELDAYKRARRTSVFDAEAEMLAIEAFLQQGNVVAARARAERSLEQAPGGPHAARLREIVAARKP